MTVLLRMLWLRLRQENTQERTTKEDPPYYLTWHECEGCEQSRGNHKEPLTATRLNVPWTLTWKRVGYLHSKTTNISFISCCSIRTILTFWDHMDGFISAGFWLVNLLEQAAKQHHQFCSSEMQSTNRAWELSKRNKNSCEILFQASV